MTTYFKDEHKKYLNILKNTKKESSTNSFLDSDYSSNISSLLSNFKNYEKGFSELEKTLVPSMEYKSKILRDNLRILNETYDKLYNDLFPKLLEMERLDNEYEEGRKAYKMLDDTSNMIDKLEEISSNNLKNKEKLIELSEEVDKLINEIKNINSNIKIFDVETKSIDGVIIDDSDSLQNQSSNTIIWNTLGENFKVANTSISVEEYASLVKQNGVYQDSNSSVYGDSCLAFAYIHASNLASGEVTDRAKDSLSYAHASEFTDFRSNDKNEVLSKIYEEINEGNPVVLQVNGNSKGTVRHFVTVVGYKESVTSASSMTEKDLLILDSWDGEIERMDTSTSRFMTTGEQVGHNYSGYWIRVLK